MARQVLLGLGYACGPYLSRAALVVNRWPTSKAASVRRDSCQAVARLLLSERVAAWFLPDGGRRMLWPRFKGPVASWPARLALTFEGPGRLATHTRMFMSAGIEGSAAMAGRLGAAWAVTAADHCRLVRAGLAAHGR